MEEKTILTEHIGEFYELGYDADCDAGAGDIPESCKAKVEDK